MKVKIGDYELFESVSLIGIDNNPIEIQIGDNNDADNEVAITFVFRFKKDEENKDRRIEYRVIDNSRLEIYLVNIGHSLGGGNTKITKIGTYKGRELYYNIRIFTLDDADNTVIVNFYLGKEVANG